MKKKMIFKGMLIAAVLVFLNIFVDAAQIQPKAALTMKDDVDFSQAVKVGTKAQVVQLLKKARAEHREEILIYTNPSKVRIENEEEDQMDLHTSIYNYFDYGYVGGLYNSMEYDVFSGPTLDYIVSEGDPYMVLEKFVPDSTNPGYGYYKIDFSYHDNKEEMKKVDQKIKSILSKVSGRSKKDQVIYIYNYLKRTLPPEKSSNNGYPRNCNGIYGALFGNGVGYVCSTYAATIQRFMELAGIPSYIVSGAYNRGEPCHAFNMIEINKKWYMVDYTTNTLLAGREDYKDDNYNGFLVRKYMAGYPLGESTLSVKEEPNPKVAQVKKLNIKQTAYNKLNLSWNKVSGVTGYQIYRSTKADSGYKRVTNLRQTSKSLTVATGSNYYYKVRAYLTKDGKNYYGSFSPAVKKKAVLSAPSITYGKSNAKTQASVKWKTTAGASGYEIMAAQDTKFTKSPKSADTKALAYTFKGLKSNTVYYVKVRAYRVVNNRKVYSSFGAVKKIVVK